MSKSNEDLAKTSMQRVDIPGKICLVQFWAQEDCEKNSAVRILGMRRRTSNVPDG